MEVPGIRVGQRCKGSCRAATPRAYKGAAGEGAAGEKTHKQIRQYPGPPWRLRRMASSCSARLRSLQLQRQCRPFRINNSFGKRRFRSASSASRGLCARRPPSPPSGLPVAALLAQALALHWHSPIAGHEIPVSNLSDPTYLKLPGPPLYSNRLPISPSLPVSRKAPAETALQRADLMVVAGTEPYTASQDQLRRFLRLLSRSQQASHGPGSLNGSESR